MGRRFIVRAATGCAVFALAATMALAQAPVRPPCGTEIDPESARKVAAGAYAAARKNGRDVAIAIDKARTAAMWRRPGKAFEGVVAAGAWQCPALPASRRSKAGCRSSSTAG